MIAGANAANARRLIAGVLDDLCEDGNKELVEGRHSEGMRKFGVSTKEEGRGKEARERLEWLFPGYF